MQRLGKNLGGYLGETIDIRTVLRDVESAANVPGTLAANFAYDLVTDTTAIRRELGYAERIARTDAIAATVSWERSHSTTTA